MRRATPFLVVALLVAGCVLAFAPFSRSGSAGDLNADGTVPTAHCSAPVVSAWRHEHAGGWFGYAPLTEQPPQFAPTCRSAARARLAVATWLWLGTAAAGFALRKPRPIDPIGGTALSAA